MAVQGEWEQGVLEMNEEIIEPMAQDETPEQDIDGLVEFPPQTDPEPEMGVAAAAAVDDTPPPPLLRQNPSPAPSETETDNGGSVLLSPSVLARMVETFRQAMSGDMQAMNANMQQMGSEINKKNGWKHKRNERGNEKHAG